MPLSSRHSRVTPRAATPAHEHAFVGYPAGRIDQAGDGYLDFIGVAPDQLRHGLGTTLVTAIAHAFLDRQSVTAMRVAVSSENAAALALYEALGFAHQYSAIGYRRPPEPAG